MVNDDGTLIGIITDGDLRRHMDGLLGKTAADVMTANPTTIASDSMAEEAVAIMNERKITCLFVVDPEAKDALPGVFCISTIACASAWARGHCGWTVIHALSPI